jgi:Flp pilus assembly protein TadG
MIIVFGIIEFGFLWMQSFYIANSAREGARIAAKMPDLDDPASKTQIQHGVREYLRGLPMYGDIADNGVYALSNPTTEIVVEPGSLADFGAASGLDPEPEAVRVSVTVQTHEVWEPILWGFLAGIFGGVEITLDQISEHAVFVKQ